MPSKRCCCKNLCLSCILPVEFIEVFRDQQYMHDANLIFSQAISIANKKLGGSNDPHDAAGIANAAITAVVLQISKKGPASVKTSVSALVSGIISNQVNDEINGKIKRRKLPMLLEYLQRPILVDGKRKDPIELQSPTKLKRLNEIYSAINGTVNIEEYLAEEMNIPLKNAMASISRDDRQIIELKVLCELSAVQVAILLGISSAAVSKRYYRAIYRLRDAMRNDLDDDLNCEAVS